VETKQVLRALLLDFFTLGSLLLEKFRGCSAMCFVGKMLLRYSDLCMHFLDIAQQAQLFPFMATDAKHLATLQAEMARTMAPVDHVDEVDALSESTSSTSVQREEAS
jgi:hypothetical protein